MRGGKSNNSLNDDFSLSMYKNKMIYNHLSVEQESPRVVDKVVHKSLTISLHDV